MIHLWWLLEYPPNRKFEIRWGVPHSSVGEILVFMQERVRNKTNIDVISANPFGPNI